MDRIRVFTTFSGYDSQCLALKYAGIPFDLVGWSEIDKHAINAHDALFQEYAERNYGDVTAIDWSTVPDFDFLTWSSPCQDISQAGRQKGLKKDSGTRSSLIWHILEAARIKKPKYMLIENVSAMVRQKFIGDFNAVLALIEALGYTNHWQVLNAKDYGVPQNRARVFVVSILGDHQPYYFPDAVRLEKRMKDVLEDETDEKYYLSQELVERINEHCERKQKEGCGFTFKPKDRLGIAQAITTKYGGRPTDCFIKEIPINANEDGTARTICASYGKEGAQNVLGITQRTNAVVVTTSFMPSIGTDFRIRKLTERECFRLMGVREDDIDKLLKAGISKTQLYKLAGNSIVCDVLMAIFDKMFVNTNAEKGQQLSLF